MKTHCDGENTLLRNAFHRRIWLSLAAFLLPRLGATLIGVRVQIPVQPFLAIDLMSMAGSLGVLAALTLPKREALGLSERA